MMAAHLGVPASDSVNMAARTLLTHFRRAALHGIVFKQTAAAMDCFQDEVVVNYRPKEWRRV